MKSRRRKFSAFTLVELLVVLVVLGTLVALAGPEISKALLQGQMTSTLSRTRQLQISTQMMALDTEMRREGMEWTSVKSKGKTRIASLGEYFDALTKGNYLSQRDLQNLLVAPGRGPGINAPTADNICFKFFRVDATSPSDQPFVVTANWQDGKLTDEAPYRKMGFVVFAKGGSGGVYRRQSDAASTNIFPMLARDAVGDRRTISILK